MVSVAISKGELRYCDVSLVSLACSQVKTLFRVTFLKKLNKFPIMHSGLIHS